MAMGLPTLVTAWGAALELLGHGLGLLDPVLPPRALVKKGEVALRGRTSIATISAWKQKYREQANKRLALLGKQCEILSKISSQKLGFCFR